MTAKGKKSLRVQHPVPTVLRSATIEETQFLLGVIQKMMQGVKIKTISGPTLKQDARSFILDIKARVALPEHETITNGSSLSELNVNELTALIEKHKIESGAMLEELEIKKVMERKEKQIEEEEKRLRKEEEKLKKEREQLRVTAKREVRKSVKRVALEPVDGEVKTKKEKI